MDTLSHGLWGGVLFGQKNKKAFWWAFIFGLIPDIFSFGFWFIPVIFGKWSRLDFTAGPPDPNLIPIYIDYLYNITHSLVIFAIVFFLVWLILKKPIIPMLAWLFHVFLDIFTHSADFFPTPFLWPFSDYYFNGWSWGNSWVFIANLVLLVILYLWFLINKIRKNKT